jgi:flagellar biosynthetic protein FliP
MLQNNPLWLVILASLIALVPVLIGMLTSYIKVNIILGFLRSGLGTQQVPGNIVIMALSLSLTAFIMAPVLSDTMQVGKSLDQEIFEKPPQFKDMEKFIPLLKPWSGFMLAHSGKKELSVISELDRQKQTATNENLPTEPAMRVIMPAFVLTEIKSGFIMGFMVLLPFLVIDLVVANVLAGMGMYMLSPVIISLPLKLILFVMADGWLLLTRGIIQSY